MNNTIDIKQTEETIQDNLIQINSELHQVMELFKLLNMINTKEDN